MRLLGKAYFNEKMMDKAISFFTLALNINTLFSKKWFTQGCAYHIKKEYKETNLAFKKATSINECDWMSWYNLTLSFNQLNMGQQALIAYEQAIKHSDNNPKIVYNYLMTALEKEDILKS